MISAFLLTAALFAAPAPSRVFQAQVDTHLKAAFARAAAVAQAAVHPPMARHGRAPRLLGR
jgi:hypothetical protein